MEESSCFLLYFDLLEQFTFMFDSKSLLETFRRHGLHMEEAKSLDVLYLLMELYLKSQAL